MKKILSVISLALLASCGTDPMDLVKETTLKDTHAFCMDAHNNNKEYCDCEVRELKKTFPWDDYMTAIDTIAHQEAHVEKVLAKYDGDAAKALEELNCPTCYFAIALNYVTVNPSPKCADLVK
ncbi:MAG: hypothetical protein LBL46_04050 [Rickettsiales bacterium]|jgi:hypothetical protein|nr:hypothetical protein [Rickettsiales bacterium]